MQVPGRHPLPGRILQRGNAPMRACCQTKPWPRARHCRADIRRTHFQVPGRHPPPGRILQRGNVPMRACCQTKPWPRVRHCRADPQDGALSLPAQRSTRAKGHNPAHRRQRRRQRYFFTKNIDNSGFSCYNKSCGFIRGEMAERFKALVLKTSDVERHRGFESLSLRQNRIDVEKYPRGRRGSPAKGVGWDNCREGSNPSFSAMNTDISWCK